MDPTVVLVEPERIGELARALTSPLRRQILDLLYQKELNVNQISQALEIPQSTAAVNVLALEKVGLVTTELRPASKGSQKVCTTRTEEVLLLLHSPSASPEDQDAIEVEMPVGLFVDFQIAPTCGMVSETGIIGYMDQPDTFLDPHRAGAQLIWFETGYLEYQLPLARHRADRATAVAISAEICSEYPTHNPDWPSDITVWINGREVGTWTSPGDMGDRRGHLNPPWWPDSNTQYGFLKEWRVTPEGSFVDGVPVSDTALTDLDLTAGLGCRVRIGIKADAENRGGLNLFGRQFGNYRQDIKMRVELA